MSNKIDGGFPIYILDDDSIVYTIEDISHCDYWEKTVSRIVAEKYGISQKDISNLPYCIRRARVVNNNLYCGEKISQKLLKKIEKTLKIKLKLVYDEHEARLVSDMLEYKLLIPHINNNITIHRV
jgi:hypothetical protein